MIFTEISHKGLHKRILEIFLSQNIDKQAKILDVGCGNGNFLNELHKIGYTNLFACDGFLENDELKKIASFSKQNLNSRLNYEDGIFDVVVLIEVIEHLENPNGLLKEIQRILKRDGTLLLSTPNIFTLVSRLLFLFEGTLFQFREVDTRFNSFPGHITPFFPYIFKEVFKSLFKIDKVYYSNFIVPILGFEIPLKNKLFGNTAIFVIKKI